MRALRRALARVLRWLAAAIDVVPDAAPLAIRAGQLVAAAEQANPAPGYGESKRHRVYAQLLKEFPAQGKRAVSRAIEEALGG